jgi:2-methylisocitrate lyase-like PEP mutase family enzyme
MNSPVTNSPVTNSPVTNSTVTNSPGMTAQPGAFAALHRRGQPFVLPNAWDVASALLLADAGFPAVGTTSLGVTAAAGLVDGAGTGRAQTLALASAIVPRLPVPVTIDLEGGYSDEPAAVAELAAELAGIGAAGINLEDAATGGGLRPPHVQANIIRAVVGVAPDLFVNARTDVYWLQVGPPQSRLAETIARLKAYEDAGASGAFVPARSRSRTARPAVRGGRRLTARAPAGVVASTPSHPAPGRR